MGEYGLGLQADSLEGGCDCLGEIYYFDTCCVDIWGELVPKTNAICLHEEDDGILWKRWDLRTDRTDVRRSRRLVLSFIAAVGHYEYSFYWYFYQDGSIELGATGTGIDQTGALHDGETTKYGASLGPSRYAPRHQLFSCVRPDPIVDKSENRVTQVNTVADPMGPQNAYGNGFYSARTAFENKLEARRRVKSDTARTWLTESSTTTNDFGDRPAYGIVSCENCLPLAQSGSSIAALAGYMWNHLWVTPFGDDDRDPAGEFPNRHRGTTSGRAAPRRTATSRTARSWCGMPGVTVTSCIRKTRP